jgi:hypothetical protein
LFSSLKAYWNEPALIQTEKDDQTIYIKLYIEMKRIMKR